MGVYIKGMKMPKSCCACPLFKSNMSKQLFCKAFGAFDKSDYDKLPIERMKNCPLIPVPPHGRLIDADELSKSFEKTANYYYEHNSEVSSSFWSGGEICTEWYAVEDLLENAPTIIETDPAEEGE